MAIRSHKTMTGLALRSRVCVVLCVVFSMLLLSAQPLMAQSFSLGNQFILNSLHSSLRPRDVFVRASEQEWQGEVLLTWSNTFLQEDHYQIDLEQRDVALSFQRAIGDGYELGFGMPIHWRGGGALDHIIREWHEWFNLPEGDRDSVEDDQYYVGGDTEEGNFLIPKRGFGMGNASIRLQKIIFQDTSALVDVAFEIGLPTAQAGFGQDGFDLMTELGAGVIEGAWTFNAGAAALMFTDTAEHGLKYHWFNFEGYGSVSYAAWEKVSLLIGVYAGRQSVDNVPTLPDGFLYLDTGITLRIAEESSCTFMVRENPYPSRASTDVTFGLRCNHLL